jgi:hypothetical protein
MQKLLDKGKLLILLDGLDEVPAQQLNQTINQIQNFADQYKQNRFIASCRTAAYQSRFRQFVDVVMADFDDSQIKQFIVNWFHSEEDNQSGTAQSCWKLLQQPAHSATKELAKTPLLLTMLCLVFDDSQNFPEKRAELYKQALDILLSKWAAEKRIQHDPIYQDLTLTLETIMLGEIAYKSFEEDRLFFSQREVVDQIRTFLASNLNAPKYLDGEVILKAIQVQQGILVERAVDIFSFSHLTLQEYLTAQNIADNNLIDQLVSNNLTEQRWREVFQLVAGLMRGGVDSFLLKIERQTQALINTPKLKALINWADKETQNSDGNFKAPAKRVVAIFLSRALARARGPDPDLDPKHELGLGPDIDRSLALNHALDRTVDIDLDRALKLAISHALGLARARALNRTLGLDRARAHALDLEKIKIFNPGTLTQLMLKLENLKSRVPQDRQISEIRPFIDQIFSTWCDVFSLDAEWLDLSRAEINALNNYLYANELMVSCKEAAVRVSPQVWAEIESRMLTVREQ